MNPYKILKIKKKATQEEIKKAFHKLAKQYHPDKENGNEEMFKKINEAYTILSDPEQRKFYDTFGTVRNSDSHKIMNTVIQNFRNYIISAIESHTFQIERVSKELKKIVNKKNDEIKTINKRISELEYLTDCVKMKKKTKINHFKIAIEELIEELNNGISNKENEIKEIKQCLKITENYKTIKGFKNKNNPTLSYTLKVINNW